MSGTGPELLLLKHETDNPHYDLLLSAGGVSGRWILRGLPNEDGGAGRGSRGGKERLALEDDSGAAAAPSGEVEDLWGKGPVEIVESCMMEIVHRGKRKIVFRVEGRALKGEYCLLLRKWGLHTKRRLWVFFKLGD
ncbi:MAG: hypothetical protein IH874_00200 [Candidatus Dadabacteria bacterium]|nr:hypothetical protein [Candidatus Dadabacteria bacterium]